MDLRARVVVPKSHEFREGARDGDVVSATPGGAVDCCVRRGVAEHERPS